jgi:transcriptional regulator of heat shock response
MGKTINKKEREAEILELIISSYIRESKPISSSYLCCEYDLNYSSATVRNIMHNLEEKGLISHIHTSSGRVPTKEGFKYYVATLNPERFGTFYNVELDFSPLCSLHEVVEYSLDALSEASGYTSLLGINAKDKRFSFRGTRCILNQPEFEDIKVLRNIFCALEVKIDKLQEILFDFMTEKVRVLIGNDIDFSEISECSLVLSGFKDENVSLVLALLGPVRMNYLKAASCLFSVKNQLKDSLNDFI